jgi:sarcosine oxidase subunit gamma
MLSEERSSTDLDRADARASCTLVRLRPCARYVLRARRGDGAPILEAYGWPAPHALLRASTQAERATLWLGPEEWLVLDLASPRAAALPRVNERAHAWVDVTHRQVAFELAGTGAAECLAAGCPLDLGGGEIAIGGCTRSVFGKCEIVLWRREAERYHLECARTQVPYVQALLALG